MVLVVSLYGVIVLKILIFGRCLWREINQLNKIVLRRAPGYAQHTFQIMKNIDAKYLQSAPNNDTLPKPNLPEYAFIGRSNVGKSSLINMLTHSKKLALVSKTPGKTKLINHFLINRDCYFVDLPGYGFAKVSKSQKKDWQRMINDYLLKRVSLQWVFLLIDFRHEPQNTDLEFIEWLGANTIPFVLLFTKADKLKSRELESHLETYIDKLLETWDSFPRYVIVSSKTRLGKEELLEFIGDANHAYKQSKNN